MLIECVRFACDLVIQCAKVCGVGCELTSLLLFFDDWMGATLVSTVSIAGISTVFDLSAKANVIYGATVKCTRSFECCQMLSAPEHFPIKPINLYSEYVLQHNRLISVLKHIYNNKSRNMHTVLFLHTHSQPLTAC